MQPQQKDIRLCKGLYKPTCADLSVVEVYCQTLILGSIAYAWIDGVNLDNPLLLPVQTLHNYKSLGTLHQYLQDERHSALVQEEFVELLDLGMRQQESATVLVRACEVMHAEGFGAAQALAVSREWGQLLNELDQAERAAYQVVLAVAQ